MANDPLIDSPESLRQMAAIIRTGIPHRRDNDRLADELDARADAVERSPVAWWRLNAYCGRLADFIVDHIGKPYTIDECGRVLEVRPDEP